MRTPEAPRTPEARKPSQFDYLLAAELKRMSDLSVNKPPDHKTPLKLEEYMEEVVSHLPFPTEKQRRFFIESVENDRDLMTFARPGDKAVPVLMPYEHGYSVDEDRIDLYGYPVFDQRRIDLYGHLYYYVLNPKNLTVRTDKKLAYMDAVLPPEIIDNAALLPENVGDLKQRGDFYAEFRENVDRLLEWKKTGLWVVPRKNH